MPTGLLIWPMSEERVPRTLKFTLLSGRSNVHHNTPQRIHLIAADFFTTEVLSWKDLITFYTLFVIELRSRSVHVCDTTSAPNAAWMGQVARQLFDAADGFAPGKTRLIIDRDTKYCAAFQGILEGAGVKIVLCPPRVPQCNAYAERFVRSIKEECLSRLIFLSEEHRRSFSQRWDASDVTSDSAGC
jgi:transposase InsO family protein